MKNTIIATALALAISTAAYAQTTPPCPAGTVTCNNSSQHMGDTDQTASADNDQSVTNQAGNHANSIASGVHIDPSIQQSGNAVSQNGNNVQGGTANATGNSLDNRNDNKSSVGNTSSNSGGNNMTTGASTSGASNGNQSGFGGSATNGSVTGGATSLKGGNSTNALTGGANTSTSHGGNQGQGQTSDNTLRGGNQALDNRNSLSGANVGDVGSSSGAASYSGGNDTRSRVDSSGNSAVGVSVDASDRSSTTYENNSRFIVIPTVTQPTPTSSSPMALVGSSTTTCGPQMVVVREPRYVYFFGAFKTKKIQMGYTDTLVPAMLGGVPDAYRREVYQDGTEVLWGSQVFKDVTVLTSAGARNLSLGGGSSSGAWGQGGAGASSSIQDIVTRYTIIPCEVKRSAPVRVIYREVPVNRIRQ